jgi:hypothetical protein
MKHIFKFLPSSSLSGVCSLILFQLFATGGKFAAGVFETGGNLPPASLTLAANLPPAVLWNCNYFLRFRFRFWLLKSYGSGSDFWKSYGSGSGSYFWKVAVAVPVPVPVPAPYLYHKKPIFLKKFVSCLHIKLFYKEKDYKYQQIYCKMWKKKMLSEGNQIRYII